MISLCSLIQLGCSQLTFSIGWLWPELDSYYSFVTQSESSPIDLIIVTQSLACL